MVPNHLQLARLPASPSRHHHVPSSSCTFAARVNAERPPGASASCKDCGGSKSARVSAVFAQCCEFLSSPHQKCRASREDGGRSVNKPTVAPSGLAILRYRFRAGARQSDTTRLVAGDAVGRSAVELWLAYNPVIVVGAGPGKVVENQNWRNHWLELSARDGSRYAAFQLARELEQVRDNNNHPTPDTVGAAQWYAFASAARADPSFADTELLARLRHRADLVRLRGREQIVSPSQDDAFLHFVIQIEVAQDYRLLADTLANSAISTRHHGDTRLIDFLYSLSPCVSSGNGDCNAR